VSILVDENTRLVVQGITGREGMFHAQQMQDYGTNVVAGVTPGKGGQKVLTKPVPVFDTVWYAVTETGADTAVIYVPASGAPDSILEAVGAGIKTVICITEHIPALDMLKVVPVVEQAGARLIGPNCPGLTSVGKAKVGIIPGNIHKPGKVGLVSRSGTLTYEVVEALTEAGIGQSTCVGIGGDPITGSSFTDILSLFRDDPETEALVLIGEIGGTAEEQAAAWKSRNMPDTPMVAFIAGRTAPPGRRMGHAGAIISGGSGTAQGKVDALEAAGVHVAETPSQIPSLLIKAGVKPS
jgi:succinyl-CoA synthetase alpha subunit